MKYSWFKVEEFSMFFVPWAKIDFGSLAKHFCNGLMEGQIVKLGGVNLSAPQSVVLV
jgi:hypothetical protein